MHFITILVPTWLSFSALAITCLVFAAAVVAAPWRQLLRAPERQHLLFGTVITLMLMWMLKVNVYDTFSFHLLLMTSAVLLLGLSFGVLAGLLALLLRWFILHGEWAMVGLDALCTVVVPALVPVLAVRLTRRLSFAGVFAFTLGAGFLGGAFSALAAVLSALGILWLAGQDTLLVAGLEQIGLLPLLMFSEGFVNGTLMTALAVFHPGLVRLFLEPE